MESAARLDVVAAIDECETDKDYVTRELLTDIITDSEEHIDFLETELALVDKVGLHNYLQSQSLPSPQ
jgi:bacterioferritin